MDCGSNILLRFKSSLQGPYMYKLAISIGLLSYSIFLFGIVNLLYWQIILPLTVLFLLFFIIWARPHVTAKKYLTIGINLFKSSKLSKVVIVLFILLAFINLIGVFGPETSFDALWYHLTIPKIYIQSHSVFYIPGNLLYYSAIPKMGDMLFTLPLFFNNEFGAKFVHFIFGILCCFAVYRLSRLFVSQQKSILAVLIFYSNIVVAWESTVAYVDLIWTFFFLASAFYLFCYFKKGIDRYYYLSALILGFTISIKLISLRDLVLFILVVSYYLVANNKNWKFILKKIIIFTVITFTTGSIWFIFSYLNTGNPIFPFFSNIYTLKNPLLFNFINIFNEFKLLFTAAPDPISPIYLIFIPLVVLAFKNNKKSNLLLVFVSFSAFFWYFTYQMGAEGRYAIPYLGMFSALVVCYINVWGKNISKLLIFSILFVAFITLFYRGIANIRYVPVLLGKESKAQYLAAHLNFKYGDFYDTDGYLAKTIKRSDRVLVYGIHNLYYVDVPFIDSTWRRPGDKFNYVLTRGGVPAEFFPWQKVYENKLTNVKLYKRK